MPIAARLSKAFYDRFGDEIVAELVEWMNTIDSTYRSELRDLNEHNFARFDAKLEQRLAELRGELTGAIAKQGSDLRKEMGDGFRSLEVKLANARSDLLLWSFVFWVGAVGSIALLAGVLG